MNQATRKKYALIWGVIFFIISIFLSNYDGWILNILFYCSIAMVVFSILTLFAK